MQITQAHIHTHTKYEKATQKKRRKIWHKNMTHISLEKDVKQRETHR